MFASILPNLKYVLPSLSPEEVKTAFDCYNRNQPIDPVHLKYCNIVRSLEIIKGLEETLRELDERHGENCPTCREVEELPEGSFIVSNSPCPCCGELPKVAIGEEKGEKAYPHPCPNYRYMRRLRSEISYHEAVIMQYGGK